MREFANALSQMFAIAEAEVRKLRHDPFDLFTRIVQPALWLLVFGQVFARLRGIPTGGVSYRDFLAPGILAQSVLFIAIFYGISTIWERDLGILAVYLVSPAPRSALVLGKSLAAGVRGLAQAIMVYILSLLLGIHLLVGLVSLADVVTMIVFSAAIFACFSMIIACLVKTRERFMGINQVLTMPLFFASNAIYPIEFDARVATAHRHPQSLNVPSRCTADVDVAGFPKRVRPCVGLHRSSRGFLCVSRHCRTTLCDDP